MNSTERILSAFEHNEGDLVPIDFNGHRSSEMMSLQKNIQDMFQAVRR